MYNHKVSWIRGGFILSQKHCEKRRNILVFARSKL